MIALRLALRNARRRPLQSALIVAGTMLATALITSSLVIGHSARTATRQLAYERLGPIDELALVDLEHPAGLGASLRRAAGSLVDGTLEIIQVPATVQTPTSIEPSARILGIDFARSHGFGRSPASTGVSGTAPHEGEAVLGEDLAQSLHVRRGDWIDIHASRTTMRLHVTRTLPRVGVAGFSDSVASLPMNVFVDLQTARQIAESSAANQRAGIRDYIALSNRGDVESGANLTRAVRESLASDASLPPLTIIAAKRELLRFADDRGTVLTGVFISTAAFGIAASVLLLINLFVMLAAERRTELGVFRAIGSTRSGVTRTFVVEGAQYCLAAALVGAMAGVWLAASIVPTALRAFNGGPAAIRTSTGTDAAWQTITIGVVVGFSVSMLTVLATSIAMARLNIVAAIQGAAHPIPLRRGVIAGLAVALSLIGFAVLLIGLALPSAELVLVGPLLGLSGIAGAFIARYENERVLTPVAIAYLAWGLVAIPVASARGADIGQQVFVTQGLLLVAGAVALVTCNLGTFNRARPLVPRRWVASRLATVYPANHRARTALILGALAVVLFMLTYITILQAMVGDQIDVLASAQTRGGFSTWVSWNPGAAVELGRLRSLPGVQGVSPSTHLDAKFTSPAGVSRSWPVTAVQSSFTSVPVPRLVDRGKYRDDVSAFRDVARSDDIAIVETRFLSPNVTTGDQLVRVGDRYTITAPTTGRSRTVRVVALTEADGNRFGAFVGPGALKPLFGPDAAPNSAFVRAEGKGADATRDRLERTFAQQGLIAHDLGKEVRAAGENNAGFFDVVRGYLALSLLIGVAGVAVVIVQSARERRREIGILRLVGMSRSATRCILMIEALFVALTASVLAVGLALLATYGLTTDSQPLGFPVRWIVPDQAIALAALLTVLATVGAAVIPAWTAAQTPPAEAVRALE